MISEHLSEFGGFQVQQWEPGQALGDPQTTIHRISTEWDDEHSWAEKFRAFLEEPGTQQMQGLVVGWWSTEDSEEDPAEVIEALVSAHARLPHLKVLFIGDITYEENEVSWIQQGDLSPILAAYPGLTHLGVRGGNGLSLGQLHLPDLRELTLQASVLDSSVVREVMNGHLPSLEHLELYLGDNGYGGDSTSDDVTPLLDGQLFPKLKYLGLKNSPFQDELAQILSSAPIMNGLETLDLSLGELTDEGLRALLASEKVTGLKRLLIRNDEFEYSSELLAELKAKLEPLGVDVDASRENKSEEDWRFSSLSE